MRTTQMIVFLGLPDLSGFGGCEGSFSTSHFFVKSLTLSCWQHGVWHSSQFHIFQQTGYLSNGPVDVATEIGKFLEPSLGGFRCFLCIQLHVSWIRPYVARKNKEGQSLKVLKNPNVGTRACPFRERVPEAYSDVVCVGCVSCVLFRRSFPGILSRPSIHSMYRH